MSETLIPGIGAERAIKIAYRLRDGRSVYPHEFIFGEAVHMLKAGLIKFDGSVTRAGLDLWERIHGDG
jgi:hypothetical protein